MKKLWQIRREAAESTWTKGSIPGVEIGRAHV